MGDGAHNHVKLTGGNQLPLVANDRKTDADQKPKKTDEQMPKHPKADAALLFDKKWNNAQAGERRNNLATMLTTRGNIAGGKNENKSDGKNIEGKTDGKNITVANAAGKLHAKTDSIVNKVVNKPDGETNGNAVVKQSENRKQPVESIANYQKAIEQPKNLLGQTWKDLLGQAKQHKDLETFRREPQKFWDDVRKMSELRTVETYVNGKLQPRVSSRYGDLLELLNRLTDKNDKNNGGTARLANFINSLSSAEKNVFLARHQINRTFGANELFAGRGIALAKNGQFPLQTFLSTSGKNQEFSAAGILSLIGGDLGSEAAAALLEDGGVFSNAQLLFNGKSSALLGLSLALYQNLDALLSLEEVVPEVPLPKTPNEPVVAPAPRLLVKSFSESAETDFAALQIMDGETLAAAALINGALATIEQYDRISRQSLDSLSDLKADDAGFRFSAGATGAMMGATVGCIVPLAEKGVGEILGFASSVVVGLTDSGLRSLGANALVSVITSGVQTFLNLSAAAAQNNLIEDSAANTFMLNTADAASEFAETDLRDSIFGRPVNAF